MDEILSKPVFKIFEIFYSIKSRVMQQCGVNKYSFDKRNASIILNRMITDPEIKISLKIERN
jgi:hypothetical protein